MTSSWTFPLETRHPERYEIISRVVLEDAAARMEGAGAVKEPAYT